MAHNFIKSHRKITSYTVALPWHSIPRGQEVLQYEIFFSYSDTYYLAPDSSTALCWEICVGLEMKMQTETSLLVLITVLYA